MTEDREGDDIINPFEHIVIEIDDVEIDGWIRVNFPKISTEKVEIRTGDEREEEQRFLERTVFEDLEVERLYEPEDSYLWDWKESTRSGDVEEAIREVRVIILDDEGTPRIQYVFHNAWIKDYDPPELAMFTEEELDRLPSETAVLDFDNMRREPLRE